MQENVSPNLYYKIFDANDGFTSVFIALNEEYYEIKNVPNQRKKCGLRMNPKI